MKKIILSMLAVCTLLALTACAGKPGGGALVSEPPVPSVAASAPAAPDASAADQAGLPSGSPDPGSEPSAVPAEAPEAPADGDQVRLEGVIGSSEIHMLLVIRDGAVSGSYYYDNPENDLKLSGAIEANRMLTMTEHDPIGEVTGIFDGWYVPGVRLTGVWTDTETGKQQEFSLEVQGGVTADAVWSGEWRRLSDIFNSANVVIFNETETRFEFQLDAYNGSHMGFLNGTAVISGTSARYRDAATGAELTFSLKGGNIELTANAAANGQAGANVVFGGSYTKGVLPETTLLSLGVVDTPQRDQAMRKLAGDVYTLFLYSAQLREDKEDLDGLGAVCAHWWVYGLMGSNESLIMLLPGGKLAAGVIDPEKNVIRVYTDDPALKAVPKTILAWADKYPELTVEFRGADSAGP